MLFYTSINHVDEIPSTFVKIFVSDTESDLNEQVLFSPILFPDPIYFGAGNEKKYRRMLSNRAIEYIYSIAFQLYRSANIVIIYDKADVKEVGYNFGKQICKYISRRYDVDYYRFTNDTTLDMKDNSKIRNIDRLIKDMKKLNKVVEGEVIG